MRNPQGIQAIHDGRAEHPLFGRIPHAHFHLPDPAARGRHPPLRPGPLGGGHPFILDSEAHCRKCTTPEALATCGHPASGGLTHVRRTVHPRTGIPKWRLPLDLPPTAHGLLAGPDNTLILGDQSGIRIN